MLSAYEKDFYAILFGSFLDVKYHWVGYFLLALETHYTMAG